MFLYFMYLFFFNFSIFIYIFVCIASLFLFILFFNYHFLIIFHLHHFFVPVMERVVEPWNNEGFFLKKNKKKEKQFSLLNVGSNVGLVKSCWSFLLWNISGIFNASDSKFQYMWKFNIKYDHLWKLLLFMIKKYNNFILRWKYLLITHSWPDIIKFNSGKYQHPQGETYLISWRT